MKFNYVTSVRGSTLSNIRDKLEASVICTQISASPKWRTLESDRSRGGRDPACERSGTGRSAFRVLCTEIRLRQRRDRRAADRR
ncbi:hypothetical protein EVAR_18913_1 [Eumeta japonica]|uniref:Uncharacterized protein n=1 Tax=Eumeta variegata TaxID=151549 RepID=A0A4C1V2K1_EUMVA|nr:hypothetical protein EVAR_18913_1 [Eumeta japonica]